MAIKLKAMDTRITTIDLGTRSYDIYIGAALLYRLGDYLPREINGAAFFIIADENTDRYADIIAETLSESGASKVQKRVIPAGEASKSFSTYQATCEWLIAEGVKRDSIIIAVGGGVVGDLTGFVAATTLRGIEFVQIPTSLLAQVDSSVGGKTGINTSHGKNLIGAFYQPSTVLIDLETLSTLPRREILAGYAEVAKYGLINDAPFFTWLEENGQAVCDLDQDATAHAIEKSVQAKALIVEADETEKGRRALLNLGHTFGHALEALARYDGRLLHGEAVAIGIIMAYDLSARLGHSSQDDLARVERHFGMLGLPTRAADIKPALMTSADAIMEAMAKDKKADQSGINFIMPRGIGDAFVTSNVDAAIVHDVIKDSLLTETTGIKERWKSAFS